MTTRSRDLQANGRTHPVVTLGVFDGVHLGHQSLLRQAREWAGHGGQGAPVWAVTFDPHPRAVVGRGAPPLLCTVEERRALLLAAGADHVEVIPFTRELSQLTPQQFVREWLHDRLGVKCVVVGENFRFGHRAAGDVDALRSLADGEGMNVLVARIAEGDGERVSSTRIREALLAGDVQRAAALLGRRYSLSGIVVRGQQRGRELGVPTANLGHSPEVLVPGHGVYAGIAVLRGRRWQAAISVGDNPQFAAGDSVLETTVEAHLLDYDGVEVYGQHMRIEFVSWLRGQQVFDDVPALVEQMHADIARARELATA